MHEATLPPLDRVRLLRTKSRIANQDLLALWKHADTDVLILKQAKGEHAKLK